MIRPKKLPRDANERAQQVAKLLTEEIEPEPDRSPVSERLAEIGRKGGIKGGKARATKLKPQRRKEIARMAAKSRWTKPRDSA